jgi:hypothetical protein
MMGLFGVLLVVLHKFVVGIGPHSEPTGGAGDFFRHVCSNFNNTVSQFNTLESQLLNSGMA